MFMQNENHESKIDVRIIVEGLDIAQLVSKAVNNIQLENDYNIIVSSIIPTVELDIVKKVASGADILLIGGYGHDETFNVLFNELKTDFNQLTTTKGETRTQYRTDSTLNTSRYLQPKEQGRDQWKKHQAEVRILANPT